MTYHLTINRLMGLCAFETIGNGPSATTPRDAAEVVRIFAKQLEQMSGAQLDSIYARIKDRSERLGACLSGSNTAADASGFTVKLDNRTAEDLEDIFPGHPIAPDSDRLRAPIVGLFRARHVILDIDGLNWKVRVRPSVTACALEHEGRSSKLWWTFEGVPFDPSNPLADEGAVTREHSVRFLEVTTALAEAAINDLRESFATTLEGVTGQERGSRRMEQTQFQVSLADQTDSNFSELLDAMELSALPFRDAIRAAPGTELRIAADEVAGFVTQTRGSAVDPNTIALVTGQGGDVAIYSKAINLDHVPLDTKKFVVSGLACSVGLIENNLSSDTDWMRSTAAPGLVRAMSAARPLSARIADVGARQLDSILASAH